MGKYGQLEEDEIEMLRDEIEMLRKLEITKEEMELFIRYTIDVLIDLPRDKWPLAVVMAPKDRIKEARELQQNAALKAGISIEEFREYTRLLSSPSIERISLHQVPDLRDFLGTYISRRPWLLDPQGDEIYGKILRFKNILKERSSHS